MVSSVAGVSWPRWHVQQVIFCAPPKLVLLMVATISIIRRAMTLVGILSETQSTASKPAPGWQFEQSHANAPAITPIAPRKSSTVSPLSVLVVTFLKLSPAVFGPG